MGCRQPGLPQSSVIGAVPCGPSHSRAKSSAEEGVFSPHMERGILSSRGDEVIDDTVSCIWEPQDPGSLWSSQRHVHMHAHTCTHFYLPEHTCTIHSHIHTCMEVSIVIICPAVAASWSFCFIYCHMKYAHILVLAALRIWLSRTFSEMVIGRRRVDTGQWGWGRVTSGMLHFEGCKHSCSHRDASRYRQGCVPTHGQI